MKNKLTRLSILALALLVGTGAFILVFNPFNGSAFAASSPTNHNVNSNATSGQVISPTGGIQPNHHHSDDDGSSNSGWDANDG